MVSVDDIVAVDDVDENDGFGDCVVMEVLAVDFVCTIRVPFGRLLRVIFERLVWYIQVLVRAAVDENK